MIPIPTDRVGDPARATSGEGSHINFVWWRRQARLEVFP
jgi:hypothetical protein